MNKPTSPEYSRGWLAGYREAAADRYTIDEVEEWLYDAPVCTALSGAKVIDRLRLHLRGPKHGLAGHRRREKWLHDTPASG